MSITLGTNIQSLRAQRQLSVTGETLGTVFERLSSGQRINRASDDAAGLAIADDLNARSRVYTQGVRNLNDGVSLFNIADSSIENLSGIVVRLKELAEQAANGVYGVEQRKALNEEAQTLKDEFFRIIQTTEFNDQKLFTADVDQFHLQGGIGDDAVLSLGVGGAIGTGSFEERSGFFTTPADLTEASTRGVTLGDVNGDGLLDLIGAGTVGFQGYATLQLGNGDGSFGAVTSFLMESGDSDAATYDVVVGDLNGDGHLDIVTAGYSYSNSWGYVRGTVNVRLGNGNGIFQEAVSFSQEEDSAGGFSASRAVVLGDLNGDGVLDLVTAGEGNVGGSNQGYATVRLGVGDGTFGDATSFRQEFSSIFSAQSNDVTLGDLDGDGILDLITTGQSQTGGGYESHATVRLGTGDGSFGTATSFEMQVGAGPPFEARGYDVEVADLNGDGNLDLVTTGISNASGIVKGSAVVRLGNGDGSFGTAVSYEQDALQGSQPSYSQALQLVDLNGDGVLDMATAGYASNLGLATVRIGVGDGTFGAAATFAQESISGGNGVTYDLAFGDLDNDGVLDLVTGGRVVDAGGNYGHASIRLGSTTQGISPLLDFSLNSISDAKHALSQFTHKLTQLSSQRGEIGSNQSRLQVATRVLDVSRENFTAAESRIRDVDVATESSNLVRMNILQQAAAAVLSQANQQPALALQLLG